MEDELPRLRKAVAGREVVSEVGKDGAKDAAANADNDDGAQERLYLFFDYRGVRRAARFERGFSF